MPVLRQDAVPPCDAVVPHARRAQGRLSPCVGQAATLVSGRVASRMGRRVSEVLVCPVLEATAAAETAPYIVLQAQGPPIFPVL